MENPIKMDDLGVPISITQLTPTWQPAFHSENYPRSTRSRCILQLWLNYQSACYPNQPEFQGDLLHSKSWPHNTHDIRNTVDMQITIPITLAKEKKTPKKQQQQQQQQKSFEF